MKNVKHGAPQLPIKWWIGEIVTCPTCQSTAELEATDKPKVWDRRAGVACVTENCRDRMMTVDKDVVYKRTFPGDCGYPTEADIERERAIRKERENE